jgi:hypothetical protein
MKTEPAPVLHRFIALAEEADFLRLGWMRERPLKPTERIEKHLGVWVLWPCTGCPPVETPSGAPVPRLVAVADQRRRMDGRRRQKLRRTGAGLCSHERAADGAGVVVHIGSALRGYPGAADGWSLSSRMDRILGILDHAGRTVA